MESLIQMAQALGFAQQRDIDNWISKDIPNSVPITTHFDAKLEHHKKIMLNAGGTYNWLIQSRSLLEFFVTLNLYPYFQIVDLMGKQFRDLAGIYGGVSEDSVYHHPSRMLTIN